MPNGAVGGGATRCPAGHLFRRRAWHHRSLRPRSVHRVPSRPLVRLSTRVLRNGPAGPHSLRASPNRHPGDTRRQGLRPGPRRHSVRGDAKPGACRGSAAIHPRAGVIPPVGSSSGRSQPAPLGPRLAPAARPWRPSADGWPAVGSTSVAAAPTPGGPAAARLGPGLQLLRDA